MMFYTLIILVMSMNPGAMPVSQTVEFYSLSRCEAARDKVEKSLEDKALILTLECVRVK